MEGDERFVAWCSACDWNVDPGGHRRRAGQGGRIGALRRRLAREHGEQLLAARRWTRNWRACGCASPAR